MRLPCKTLQEAYNYARAKADETQTDWFVNRLASSGPMKYEASDSPIMDTSFGGGMVKRVMPDGADIERLPEGSI